MEKLYTAAYKPNEVGLCLCPEITGKQGMLWGEPQLKIHVIDGQTNDHSDLKAALDASGVVGTWDWDLISHVVRYDRGAAELLAGDRTLAGQLLDRTLAGVCIHHEDVEWLYEEFIRSAKPGGILYAEYRVMARNGKVSWLLTRGRFSHDALGRPVRCRGILIDITENREPGKALVVRPSAVGTVDPWDTAVEHCLKVVEALEQEPDAVSLSLLARALLLQLGHAMAARLYGRDRAGRA